MPRKEENFKDLSLRPGSNSLDLKRQEPVLILVLHMLNDLILYYMVTIAYYVHQTTSNQESKM